MSSPHYRHERAEMKVRRRCRNKRVSEFGAADAHEAIRAERRAMHVLLDWAVRIRNGMKAQ